MNALAKHFTIHNNHAFFRYFESRRIFLAVLTNHRVARNNAGVINKYILQPTIAADFTPGHDNRIFKFALAADVHVGKQHRVLEA